MSMGFRFRNPTFVSPGLTVPPGPFATLIVANLTALCCICLLQQLLICLCSGILSSDSLLWPRGAAPPQKFGDGQNRAVGPERICLIGACSTGLPQPTPLDPPESIAYWLWIL